MINYSIKDKKDFLWEVAGSRMAPSVSGVKYFLNESDVDKKAVIIDVRSELEFKYGSLKGAFNLPYSFNSSRGKSQPPNALSIFQDTWKVATLPIDHSTPIVLYGQDIFDTRPWAAYLMLNILKYPNIGWFRAGYDGIKNLQPEIIQPKDYPMKQDHILSPKQFFEVMKENPDYVYVGEHEIQKNMFPLFFKAKYVAQSGSSKSLTANSAAQLKSGGDLFDYQKILNDKSKMIIVMDYDNASNNAIKAALWLQADGYQNVYVYPNGVNSILELSLALPEKFNCLVLGPPNKCN